MIQIPPEYIAIGRIVVMMKECVAARGNCGFSRWTDSPNPFYCQTASGLFLQLCYDIPWRLWTPWGEHLIERASWSDAPGAWADVFSAMAPRLGAELHSECRTSIAGNIGAIYSLSKVDDIQLPAAVMRDPGDYVGRDEIKRAWQDVVKSAGNEVSP